MTNDGWIKCSDRLPEQYKLSICATRTSIDPEPYRVIQCFLLWDNDNWVYDDPKSTIYSQEVSHWQPLPEPPTDEE